MTKKLGVLIVVALLATVATWGSNPGEPLDSDDFVLTLPGLSTSELFTPRSGTCGNSSTNVEVCMWIGGNTVDAEGNTYLFLRTNQPGGGIPTGIFCGDTELARLEIQRITPNGEREVVAFIDDRCFLPNAIDTWEWSVTGQIDGLSSSSLNYNFDLVSGVLRFRFRSLNSDRTISRITIIEIMGFPTLFEVKQSYTPPSGPLSFTVPAHPEGMASADWFDTYYIPMTLPIDFTQAQPLACGFPVSTPDPGDYLTVADTAPPLQPGQGYFYITAANYNGERRYGRQSLSGVRTGRDPALLPECI